MSARYLTPLGGAYLFHTMTDNTSGKRCSGDEAIDRAVRPKSFGEYVGQEQIKSNLSIMVEAARQRGEPVDHLLFCGPPGLGKTTIANIIANEMGAKLHTTSGPALEKKADLVGILLGLGENDVLFIDEIHRMKMSIEELLYPAMEDFHVEAVVGTGARARAVKLPLKPFTLVGATTLAGLISNPLRDRFGYVGRLQYYSVDELKGIVLRSADKMRISIGEMGAVEIAQRSRGTPRLANRFLRRLRDFGQVLGDGVICPKIAREALEALGIDAEGLDEMDRRIVLAIIDHFDGGPVGIETLGASVGEVTQTIEEVHEPYLVQQGFLRRTSRGREATRKAYNHFGRRYTHED